MLFIVFGSNLKNAIISFAASLLLIYLFKPRLLFDDNKRVRQFGVGFNRDKERKTLFNMSVFVLILAITCFAITY